MEKLITSAQDLTTSWANLGEPISVANKQKLALWLDVDINNSTDVQFRAVPMKTSVTTATKYSYPIRYVSSSKVSIQDEVFELSDDADQNIVVEIETKGLIPYLQIQVKTGVVGATAGQIDSAEISLV